MATNSIHKGEDGELSSDGSLGSDGPSGVADLHPPQDPRSRAKYNLISRLLFMWVQQTPSCDVPCDMSCDSNGYII